MILIKADDDDALALTDYEDLTPNYGWLGRIPYLINRKRYVCTYVDSYSLVYYGQKSWNNCPPKIFLTVKSRPKTNFLELFWNKLEIIDFCLNTSILLLELHQKIWTQCAGEGMNGESFEMQQILCKLFDLILNISGSGFPVSELLFCYDSLISS